MTERSKNPPVGLYDVDKAYNHTQTSRVGATLKSRHGTFLNEKRLGQISPGPAQYLSTLNFIGKDVTAITIKGKPRYHTLNKNPGPGSYQMRFS